MKRTLKILLLTVFLIFAISMLSNVKGANATITASKNPASVGDSVTINVNINAASWNLKASGTGVSGGTYVGFTSNLNNESKTEKLTLDTSTSGSKTIILSGDVTDENGSTTPINTSVTVVVNERQNGSGGSSDTSLASITIDGENYKLNSTKTVSADTSTVTIKATPNSSKAKVAGTGTKELLTGTNKFTLTVTAENGTKRNVTVTIVREEAVDDNPNIIDPSQEEGELRLVLLEIEGATLSPFFDEGIFEYTASVVNLDELRISAISNIEDADIEITGNTDLVEGENIVIIKLTKDERETEYQITVTKVIELLSEVEEKDTDESKVGFFGTKAGKLVLGGVIIILLIAIIVVIFKMKTDDDDYDRPSKSSRKEARRRASYDDFD